MALERKVLFESITAYKDGTVSLLVNKAVVDGEELISERLHRVTFPAGATEAQVSQYMDEVHAAIQREGFPGLPDEVRDKPKAQRDMMKATRPVPVPKPRVQTK